MKSFLRYLYEESDPTSGKKPDQITPEDPIRLTRFTSGKFGFLNNQALNYDKLSDDEMSEMETVLPLGLEQPRNVPAGAEFHFTDAGLQKHERLITLAKKAAKIPVTTTVSHVSPKHVVWKSGDGQIAAMPEHIIKAAQKNPLDGVGSEGT